MYVMKIGLFALALWVTVATAQEAAKPPESANAKTGEARKLVNPVPYSKGSLGLGKSSFARLCASCHGPDGKAMVDVVADATDLTLPATWKYGTSDVQMFRSIREGRGASMPAFLTQVKKEEDLWQLVNFVRSLGPESAKPPLQDSEAGPPAAATQK